MSFRIYLVARPHLDLGALSAFLEGEGTTWRRTPETSDPEGIVELAGRVCYMSFGDNQSRRTNHEYIQNLLMMGHESVLEHAAWTFLLSGVSRAFTHQLVRHRVGFAFSQLSQQYHDESETEVVEPAHLRESPEAWQAWSRATQAAKEAYKTITRSLQQLEQNSHRGLRRKELQRAIRSAARSVLPNAAETKIVVTANARAIRHFMKVRGTIPGDTEMREVACGILKLLKVEAPALFSDFDIETLPDGLPIVVHGRSEVAHLSVEHPL